MAVATLLCAAGTGCAPGHLLYGVPWTIRHADCGDAAAQRVRGLPTLRTNTYLLDQLAHVEDEQDIDAARIQLNQTVAACHNLARHAINNEIDQLPDKAANRLWTRYFADAPGSMGRRAAIRRRFWRHAVLQYAALGKQVAEAQTLEEIHGLARGIRRATAPSPKDRHGGGLLLALVAASIKVDEGPLDHGGPVVDVYEPSLAPPVRLASDFVDEQPAAREWLARYAPIIVQERVDNAGYAPETDRIGTVRMAGTIGKPRVVVGTAQASVYAYSQYAIIHGKRRLQLTYTYWFPRHPALKPLDAEKGRIEGATLRITLDADHRPAIFETLLNCGCYHRCYPAEHVEAAACREHGAPVRGKSLCIERAMPGKIDWIVPETVEVPVSPARPVLFSRAGYHGPAGVGFDKHELDTRTIHERSSYILLAYENLEHLPFGNRHASMFESNGLVRGAGRPEGTYLALTGMLSAGQPRQRGTQRVHWDQYDFDDPHLVETCLRLPGGF